MTETKGVSVILVAKTSDKMGLSKPGWFGYTPLTHARDARYGKNRTDGIPQGKFGFVLLTQ